MRYLLFFSSGVAALMYEVVWARSLGLVFGASHLAVTTVLAVYMGGHALGGALLGRRADSTARPLRLYGLLELGIGLSGLAFLAMTRIYPALYGPLARAGEGNPLYLTVLRVAFAVVAMIVPTTFMGGTLPALSRLAAGHGGGTARQVSFLYGVNTLGAVVGTLGTGFLLLQTLGATGTTLLASAVSAAVGLAALLLDRRPIATPPTSRSPDAAPAAPAAPGELSARLALVGVGISGFCALGYEVLWTRMLTFVVGTSVYSFTIMLGAFLTGIALGSHAFGLLGRWAAFRDGRGAARVFAGTQVAIGLTALGVTILMRHLPATADRVQAAMAGIGASTFGGRLISSFAIAFAYLFAPAFFMGMAFPAAGAVWTAGGRQVGAAVGRLVTSNTVGAILGSAVSGYVLIYAFGIERSLQLLVIVNIATGVAVAASVSGARGRVAAVAACAAALLVARGVNVGGARVWDQRFFAIYTNTGRTAASPERVAEFMRDTEVLYYREGVNETVSVIRPRGDVLRSFIVNGRPEASTAPMDVQLQRALGHVPMLLHPHPRRVFVLGTGTGMTLGATAIHPEVEQVVLAEIEEGVLGVARTFADWNGHVLDNPRLRIVINDGRNFLTATTEKFDVITSDPIHPWSGGAGYLYTVEYFRTVAAHLAPGGVASHWLPLYELSTGDVKSVVRSFAAAFPHVMIWLTYYDAVLVGSNDPLRVDEGAVARRLADPRLRGDLAPLQMGSAEDLLSFFAMGDAGARAFARGGALNTDDNLFLEFSAPRSQGIPTEATNFAALGAHRESLVPYLAAGGAEERRSSVERWTRKLEAARLFDAVHTRYLAGDRGSPALRAQLSAARARDPGFAPLGTLLEDITFWSRAEPALVDQADFDVCGARGGTERLRLSAVRQLVGRGRVLVSIVDNAGRDIYGQGYLYGRYEELEDASRSFLAATLDRLRTVQVGPAGGACAAPGRSELSAALRGEAARLVGAPPVGGAPVAAVPSRDGPRP